MQSGKQFVDALNIPYSFSEYWMEWKPESTAVAVPSNLSLREAIEEDQETLIQLNVSGFSMTEEDALALYQSCGFHETGANDYYELIL